MKNAKHTLIILMLLICAISNSKSEELSTFLHIFPLKKEMKLTVRNTLDFDRKEVVAIPVKMLKKFLKDKEESAIRIKDAVSGIYIPLQWIDYKDDGKRDELLFQATVKANGTTNYIMLADASVPMPVSEVTTYSRFVPERTDDYAWENDRVAFRTYGPDAQRRVEEHRENGTLSSGIDLWLKRTPKPVINSWYSGYLTDPMYYHKDRGEGYDPYHVGASRGTGGSGIWTGDSLLVSKNFTAYKTIAAGPLRTVFELTYASWSDYKVQETKRISLDVGTNFSKFEVSYTSERPLPNYTIGITLHKKEGQTAINQQLGVFSHTEAIDGVLIGEGIVVNPDVVEQAFANLSDTPDQSNLLVVTTPARSITYYAGFAWQKSRQVTDAADWMQQLEKQAKIIEHPLKVTLK